MVTVMIPKRIAATLALALGMGAVPNADAQRFSRPGFQGGGAFHAPGRTSAGPYFNPKEFTVDKPVPWPEAAEQPAGHRHSQEHRRRQDLVEERGSESRRRPWFGRVFSDAGRGDSKDTGGRR